MSLNRASEPYDAAKSAQDSLQVTWLTEIVSGDHDTLVIFDAQHTGTRDQRLPAD
jgi:hypothetical protein